MVRAIGSSSASRIFMVEAAGCDCRRRLEPPLSSLTKDYGLGDGQLKCRALSNLSARNNDSFSRLVPPALLGSAGRVSSPQSLVAVLDDHRVVCAGVGAFALRQRELQH